MKKTLILLLTLTTFSGIKAEKPCIEWPRLPQWLDNTPSKYISDKRKKALLIILQASTELCKIKRATPVAVKCEVVDEVVTMTTKRHTLFGQGSLKIAGAKKCLLEGQPEVITEKTSKSCMVIGAVAYGLGTITGLGVCVLAK